MRHGIVGPACIRHMLGVGQDDAEVFRPVTLAEAVEAASIVSTDASVAECRTTARVGIVYDLMPLHVRPPRRDVARALRLSEATVLRREAEWEMSPALLRFDLVHRAMRSVMAIRASALR